MLLQTGQGAWRGGFTDILKDTPHEQARAIFNTIVKRKQYRGQNKKLYHFFGGVSFQVIHDVIV